MEFEGMMMGGRVRIPALQVWWTSNLPPPRAEAQDRALERQKRRAQPASNSPFGSDCSRLKTKEAQNEAQVDPQQNPR